MDLIETQRMRSPSNKNAEKSTKRIAILPLMTVWLRVRVLPGPPRFTLRVTRSAATPDRTQLLRRRVAKLPVSRNTALGLTESFTFRPPERCRRLIGDRPKCAPNFSTSFAAWLAILINGFWR